MNELQIFNSEEFGERGVAETDAMLLRRRQK